MKRYTLTRREASRLQRDPGDLAETIAADEYRGFSVFGVENFDISTTEGALGEVKSTATRLESGARGRFRLWKKQHERLLRADREGSAWYVFVLWDVSENPPVARLVRKKPADVGRQIGARGGWNESAHTMGPQKKVPTSAIF